MRLLLGFILCLTVLACNPRGAHQSASEHQLPVGVADRYYGAELIPGVDNDTIYEDSRLIMAEYPPQSCDRYRLGVKLKLPKPWVLRACAPNAVLAIARLSDLHLTEKHSRALMDRYVLVKILSDPAAFEDFNRRLNYFDRSVNLVSSPQDELGRRLGRPTLDPYFGTLQGQENNDGDFIGQGTIVSINRDLVCDIKGPNLYLFDCVVRGKRHILYATFLRDNVSNRYPELLTNIHSLQHAMSGTR